MFEFANANKIEIIPLNRLLKVFAKFDKTFEYKGNSFNTNINNSERKLRAPFIKIVDNSCKFKPTYKELSAWPEMNFDYQPELCPFFRQTHKPILNNNNHNPNPQNPSANISQQSNKSTTFTYKQLNEKCTVLTTPRLTDTNTNKSLTMQNKDKNVVKKKHLIYCEICHQDYYDFETVN